MGKYCRGCGFNNEYFKKCRMCKRDRCLDCVKRAKCCTDRFTKGYRGQRYSGSKGEGILFKS